MNSSINWGLKIRPKVYKELDKFPKKDAERIIFTIEQLPIDPYAGDIEKLESGDTIWRRRIGNYRIFYEIKNNEKNNSCFSYGTPHIKNLLNKLNDTKTH
ncbi:MAG: type II toxin-antitoxin system RelE/ParE family toxin [Candidatus Paceibacterota bacterium]